MNISYLRKTEIVYELAIRGFNAINDIDVVDLKSILRKYIAEAVPILSEVHITMTDQDKTEIASSLAELEKNLSQFPGKDAKIAEKKILSRLAHVRNRIQRYVNFELADFNNFKTESLNKCDLIEVKLSRTKIELTKAMSSTFLEGRNFDFEINDSDQSDSEIRPPCQNLNSKAVPVYKWGISFSGQSETNELLDFLEKVEELRLARGVSKSELFRSAIDLFSGPAVSWFRSTKSRVNNWDDLVACMKRDFLPEDIDDFIWDKLRDRKQGKTEKSIIFIAAMENLFSRLTNPPDELSRVKLIRKNLLPVMIAQLCLFEIDTIPSLTAYCRKIENSKSESNMSHLQVLDERIDNNSNVIGMLNELSKKITTIENKFSKMAGSNNKITSNSGANKTLLTEDEKCWNCDKSGHRFYECTSPKRNKFCFGCGKKGVNKKECADCSKN